MARYTYEVQDLATGKPLADLPLSCTSGLPRTVSSDASATFTLDIGDPRIRALDPVSATDPGRVALFALRDDIPVWGGIIWGRSYRAATTTLTLQASTVESYWRYRYWTAYWRYNSVDQLYIAASLLHGARAATGFTTWIRSDGTTFTAAAGLNKTVVDSDGNLLKVNTTPAGINISGYTFDDNAGTVGGTASGVLRYVEYLPGKNVYDAIGDLAGADNGFEWTADPARFSDGSLGWNVRFGYTQLGRLEDVTGLQYDYEQGTYDRQTKLYRPGTGSNIVDYELTPDATGSGLRIVTTGQETDAQIPNVVRGDLRLLKAGYPLLEVTSAYSDASDAGTLEARATGDLTAAVLPRQVSTWTVLADGDMGFGTAQMGDRGVFNVSDLFTPRQAGGLPGRMSVERIVGWNLIPEQRDQPERWQLTTNPVSQPSPALPKSELRRLQRIEAGLRSLTTTARQAKSVQPANVVNPGWVTVPNAPSGGSNGATVAVSDIAFTKMNDYLQLGLAGYYVGSSAIFLHYSLFDAGTGTVLDANTVIPTADLNNVEDFHVTGLGAYQYGDEVRLRLTVYMFAASDPLGTTFFRLRFAQQRWNVP